MQQVIRHRRRRRNTGQTPNIQRVFFCFKQKPNASKKNYEELKNKTGQKYQKILNGEKNDCTMKSERVTGQRGNQVLQNNGKTREFLLFQMMLWLQDMVPIQNNRKSLWNGNSKPSIKSFAPKMACF